MSGREGKGACKSCSSRLRACLSSVQRCFKMLMCCSLLVGSVFRGFCLVALLRTLQRIRGLRRSESAKKHR
ncbi:unnamed protein product [Amoebophrya sp. A25]|nr:unnamed protein product [Amoebophrya sp. A25]|eukprot:GSA25T00000357001.1